MHQTTEWRANLGNLASRTISVSNFCMKTHTRRVVKCRDTTGRQIFSGAVPVDQMGKVLQSNQGGLLHTGKGTVAGQLTNRLEGFGSADQMQREVTKCLNDIWQELARQYKHCYRVGCENHPRCNPITHGVGYRGQNGTHSPRATGSSG